VTIGRVSVEWGVALWVLLGTFWGALTATGMVSQRWRHFTWGTADLVALGLVAAVWWPGNIAAGAAAIAVVPIAYGIASGPLTGAGLGMLGGLWAVGLSLLRVEEAIPTDPRVLVPYAGVLLGALAGVIGWLGGRAWEEWGSMRRWSDAMRDEPSETPLYCWEWRRGAWRNITQTDGHPTPEWLGPEFRQAWASSTWRAFGVGGPADRWAWGFVRPTMASRHAMVWAWDRRAERATLARREAERLNHLIAGILHEARNPLAVIQSAGSLMEDLTIPEEDRARLRRSVADAAARLGDLFRGVEQYGQLGGGTLSQFTVADLERQVNAAVSARGLDPNRLQWPSCPDLFGDFDLLYRVVVNLSLNALAHAPAPTAVTWEVEVLPGGGTEWHCRDAGPGIPEELLPLEVERIRSSLSRGRGIGLAVAARACVLLDGHIQYARAGDPAHTIISCRLGGIAIAAGGPTAVA
jgi:hypothetical protein